jgi:hypothetical protein
MATTSIQTKKTTEVIESPKGMIGGGIEGEFDSSDISTPYLSILQPNSNSEFKRDHEGSWFVKSMELPLGEHIEVIICGMRKQWEEVLTEADRKADPSRFPTIFTTKAAGLDACAEVRPCAEFDLAIKLEKGDDGFDKTSIKHDGAGFLLARYSATGRSYKLARTCLTAHNLSGDSHVCGHYFNFGTLIKPAFNQDYRIPTATLGDPVPADLQEKIINALG